MPATHIACLADELDYIPLLVSEVGIVMGVSLAPIASWSDTMAAFIIVIISTSMTIIVIICNTISISIHMIESLNIMRIVILKISIIIIGFITAVIIVCYAYP